VAGRTRITTRWSAGTELLNILAAREGRGSTVVAGQFDPEDWYRSLHDAVMAGSILNRNTPNCEEPRNLKMHAVSDRHVLVLHGLVLTEAGRKWRLKMIYFKKGEQYDGENCT
jgi:hypothetical protein